LSEVNPRDKGNSFSIRVSETEEGKRFDQFLVGGKISPPLSRSQAKRLIEEGMILLNGRRVKASSTVRAGDVAVGVIPGPEPLSAEPEALPLAVLYEDEEILVLDKPAGLVVHPSTTGSSGTLVNALLYHCRDLPGIKGVIRPGIVHRLDKDTSGVMVVAKTEAALADLGRQFKERHVEKTYLAIVHGMFREQEGTIDAAIGRHPTERKKMSIHARSGRGAVTRWRLVEAFSGHSLLELRPQTGRTHQIRVHLASIGHPVLGDALYGRKGRPGTIGDLGLRDVVKTLNRQALHAHRLTFAHPRTGERLTFTSPVPPDMEEVLTRLRTMDGKKQNSWNSNGRIEGSSGKGNP
jgi:23S rRNA pseudouridine1911/1915/1917 synthase